MTMDSTILITMRKLDTWVGSQEWIWGRRTSTLSNSRSILTNTRLLGKKTSIDPKSFTSLLSTWKPTKMIKMFIKIWSWETLWRNISWTSSTFRKSSRTLKFLKISSLKEAEGNHLEEEFTPKETMTSAITTRGGASIEILMLWQAKIPLSANY